MTRASLPRVMAWMIGLMLLALVSAEAAGADYDPITTVKITDNVLLKNSKRMGINVGYYDQFGAAQFMKNLIPNPGFEGAEMASIILADGGATSNRVRAAGWSVRWLDELGGPEFWRGGTYEVLTGPAQGRTGKITGVSIENGRHVFTLGDHGTPPPYTSVIAIRSPQIGGYYMSNRSANVVADPEQYRPGSPGRQSLRVQPKAYNSAPLFYVAFDSLARDGDPSAGKMHLVEGNWRIDFWAKAADPNTTVEVKFGRHRGKTFFKETVRLHSGWQRVSRRFYVPPGADSLYGTEALTLNIAVSFGQGAIWLDDMALQNVDNKNPTAFSDNFVELLKELQPGVLRDWGHQFGSSLDNQLAHPMARRSTGFHPHKLPKEWHYSLHEFLMLSKVVGSEPWYVIPPTWSSAEIQNFIAYLSAPAGSHPYANRRAALGQPQPWTHVFHKIHLEYGNELWSFNADNQPGQGFAMGGAIGTADAASRRFALMRGAPFFNPNKFNLIISGQVNHPDLQGQIERRLGNHNAIGVAPYFGDIQQYHTNEQLFQPIFASAMQDVATYGRMFRSRQSIDNWGGQRTDMVVYEVNTQLRPQNAPLHTRNEWYTSLGTGLALPLHMLTYQRDLGVNEQAAFTAAQYSKPVRPGQWDRVWGLLRDVEATQRKRPGWLGMEMANMAIRGDMVETIQSGSNPKWTQPPINGIPQTMHVPYVQSFAYRGWGNQYSIVLFNLHLNAPQTVQLELPHRQTSNATIHTLTANNIRANNELGENVRIRSEQRNMGEWPRVTLPPHSMIVVQWNR